MSDGQVRKSSIYNLVLVSDTGWERYYN